MPAPVGGSATSAVVPRARIVAHHTLRRTGRSGRTDDVADRIDSRPSDDRADNRFARCTEGDGRHDALPCPTRQSFRRTCSRWTGLSCKSRPMGSREVRPSGASLSPRRERGGCTVFGRGSQPPSPSRFGLPPSLVSEYPPHASIPGEGPRVMDDTPQTPNAGFRDQPIWLVAVAALVVAQAGLALAPVRPRAPVDRGHRRPADTVGPPPAPPLPRHARRQRVPRPRRHHLLRPAVPGRLPQDARLRRRQPPGRTVPVPGRRRLLPGRVQARPVRLPAAGAAGVRRRPRAGPGCRRARRARGRGRNRPRLVAAGPAA